MATVKRVLASRLKWDDKTIYKWTIKRKRVNMAEQLFEVIFLVIGGFVFAAMLYLALYLIGLASHPVAFWIAFAVTLIVFLGLTRFIWYSLQGREEQKITSQFFAKYFSLLCAGSLAYMISSPASFLHAGFIGNTDAGALPWASFLGGVTLSVISFGITAIPNLRLSDIEAYTWAARLSVFLLSLFVSMGLLQLVIYQYRNSYRSESFYGTVRECYAKCDHSWSIHAEDEVLREAEVRLLPTQETIHMDSFLSQYKTKAGSLY